MARSPSPSMTRFASATSGRSRRARAALTVRRLLCSTRPQDPATGPVLLTLLPASLSLQLVFAGPSQLLAEISLPTLAPLSLSPPAGVTLTSGSDVLVGQGTGPLTKRDVSRIFGPTFDTPSTRFGAGRPSDNAAGVEVWYPGLGFGFGPSPASAGTGEPDICRQIWICDRSRRPVVAGPEVQPAPADESMPSRSVRPGALVKALINVSPTLPLLMASKELPQAPQLTRTSAFRIPTDVHIFSPPQLYSWREA